MDIGSDQYPFSDLTDNKLDYKAIKMKSVRYCYKQCRIIFEYRMSPTKKISGSDNG